MMRARLRWVDASIAGLEQTRVGIVETAHRVVIQDQAVNPTVLSKRTGLFGDFLSCKDAANPVKKWIASQKRELTRELINAIHSTAPLHLDRDWESLRVSH